MDSLPDRLKDSSSGNLAAGVSPPITESREEFVRQAVCQFGDEEYLAAERWNAARRLLSDGDLTGMSGNGYQTAVSRGLAAWLLTPRENFIPPDLRREAYMPRALPLGHNQTISAPYMVSRMTAALNPGPDDGVLEIGTGSGYQAAMLSVLSSRVRTIETVGPLAADAAGILEKLAAERPWLSAIRQRTGNGYRGWEEGAPYDRIIVTCAIDHVPRALLEQTAPGGIIIIPLGERRVQNLRALRRRLPGESAGPDESWLPASGMPGFDSRDVYGDGTRVVFVPFVS